jgi:hypothetical protein
MCRLPEACTAGEIEGVTMRCLLATTADMHTFCI